MMKKILFIILLISMASSLFAQKQVRKAVRTGNKAYDEQRYGAAEAEYDKALKENASSKEASFNLANTYYKQQRWDDALKEFQHYLTLESEDEPKMSAAWSNMGNTFLKKKANEKAETQSAIAQGQQPQKGGQQTDNLKMSMDAYKNALRLNPNDEETRYNLAVVQKMIKDKEGQDKDQKQDQKDQNQDQNKEQNKDQKQDKQDQKQDQNQMSQDNIQQILQAIEQDEKDTQERVKQAKAQERKQKNDNNKRQDKDW